MPATEFRLIELLRGAGADRADVRTGIGDDAAVLDLPAGARLVSSVDALVAGVHFPDDCAAQDLGWRALAVNLSDFAAMGAEPRWATLVLSLPTADENWTRDFVAGLSHIARAHEVALVGGDTVRGPLAVSLQLMGVEAPEGSLLRSGARAGDDVWVSGSLGDAAAGLALIQGELQAPQASVTVLQDRFLRPEPRVGLGRALAGVATAALDISDGLVIDAGRLARASGRGLQIDMGRVPLSAALRAAVDHDRALNFAVAGGDDYELLFTAERARRARIESLAAARNMSCTRIGSVVDGQTVTCVLESEPWIPSHTGFDHFGRGAGR